ncbi:hypothetical protein BBJ28_00019866, partial [Nothophytophthora sp. Chile5]
MVVKVGDTVLVFHGPALLDAVVQEIGSGRSADAGAGQAGELRFFVRYLAEQSQQDEWVGPDSMLENTAANRKLQEEELAAAARKSEASLTEKSEASIVQKFWGPRRENAIVAWMHMVDASLVRLDEQVAALVHDRSDQKVVEAALKRRKTAAESDKTQVEVAMMQELKRVKVAEETALARQRLRNAGISQQEIEAILPAASLRFNNVELQDRSSLLPAARALVLSFFLAMATPTGNEEEAQQARQLGYESGAALMAEGPHVLHDHVATKLETALGRALPQMDVRFSNLSVTADIVMIDDNRSRHELPTLPNTVMKAFVGPKKRVVHKEILKNVSGSFKPGTITLLLGQPGSGKSSLMKMLSGRFPIRKNITVEGDITYNDVSREKIVKTLPQFVAYVNQRDKHFATLTVKETLEFAHKFCGGELSRRGEELLSNGTEKENLEALEAAQAMFRHFPEVVIEQLGLQNCQDTIVGDAMMRGISGGERKRVTTGEMEFGMKYVTLMDEISTGLDSAATYDIINTQRSVAQKLRKTVVIALLQPSPEVFALFDDV